MKWEGDGSIFSQILNNLDSQYGGGGCFRPCWAIWVLEGILPTMGVFSVVPDPTRMGVFSGVER